MLNCLAARQARERLRYGANLTLPPFFSPSDALFSLQLVYSSSSQQDLLAVGELQLCLSVIAGEGYITKNCSMAHGP